MREILCVPLCLHTRGFRLESLKFSFSVNMPLYRHNLCTERASIPPDKARRE